ncbi:axin-2-like [Sinocyclocheilus rhinocerous]|uniref:Axin-2-like n=1 Tax=Sinocyclocheilus rhinocerous TaxID=307959 RepID=A0A673II34_9TELE|nr:PREDICTED: axin-2-like [Sinocyclocheilus rhinocerous]XP_016429955.1 PREDICTED: axin-2-like [Sinocyclocheilus rhinocerous]XP_016429956.1 PREDICTED: axin-2-like [Sinocyclocheilus rhinocerous]
MNRTLTDPMVSSFREDDPRPPVPGEEGETTCHHPSKLAMMRPKDPVKTIMADLRCSTARRDDDGLGEPEGSASPDSPLARWTKSLHFLLGDQDGAQLFRAYLEREKCEDTLDFWFACNGFRQMDLKDTKTHRVAKAIYKRYIENNSVVAKQLKPATKTFIRDNIKRQQIDSAMFDQAQMEIQTAMEENAYQMFLTSDIYLEYVRTGCENGSHMNPNGLGGLKLVCGYLPTLNEEEEWSCNDFKAKALATVVGLSAKALRSPPSLRAVEALEKGYRSYRRSDPGNPYRVASGYSFAPATSANDSEVSSDALTDDSMSMTDSSVDAIPPYKLGSKKQLQREMQRNMRMNGQVSLPPFPRTRRPPKEMTPVEPAAFAAQLIARLDRLKREQETMSSLEERLQQIQEEEEKDESEVSGSSACHSLPLLPPGSCEEDPQAILDEHLSRVLKTPGCQSPGMLRHSPRSRSPEQRPLPRGGPGTRSQSGSGNGYVPSKTLISRQSTKHIYHHYIHHHAEPKSKEQIEAEATQRVQCLCHGASESCSAPYNRSRSLGRDQCGSPAEVAFGHSSSLSKRLCKSGEEVNTEGLESSLLQLPADSTDRSQNVWQWILESDRQTKHKPHSTQNVKKSHCLEPTRTHTWGGGGSSAHLRAHQPAHPFVQDPAMPPLPPPNTLAQLEEARRRLEEVSKPSKQRHSTSSLQRDKSHPVPVQNGSSALQTDEPKDLKKMSGSHSSLGSETVVTYFFCGEEIPYRRMMKTHSLTLGHFKEQLRKKGNYRYYFKKASDEFECGAVFEEVWDDCTVLPIYEGKILGKVERMD